MKTNLNDWDCEDSINWIKGVLKGESCRELLDPELIRSHQINGRDLIDLNEDNLKYDLKITNLHLRKLLLRKICELLKFINENIKNTKNSKFRDSSNEKEFLNNIEKFRIVKFKYKNIVLNIKCHKNLKFVDIFEEFSNNEKNRYISQKFCILDNNKNIIPKNSLIFDFANEGDMFELIENFIENTNNHKTIRNFSNMKDSGSKYPSKKIKKKKNYSLYNGNHDYKIQETASKNRLLSFDALDSLEKNGYTFTVKKNLQESLEKEKEKVTINSYYNISNLNHYNSNKYEGNKSALVKKNEKSNKKKNRMNFSLSHDDEKSSHSDPPQNLIRIEDPCIEKQPKNLENYMNKFISSQRSYSSLNNQSCNSEKSKKLFDKKLSNYYVDAKKIRNKKNDNILNVKESKSSANEIQDKENEIENFLKSLKRSSTFILPSESNSMPTDSRLKTYIQETKKYKNTVKNNLRHLIHKNITSSVSNEKQYDSSISN